MSPSSRDGRIHDSRQPGCAAAGARLGSAAVLGSAAWDDGRSGRARVPPSRFTNGVCQTHPPQAVRPDGRQRSHGTGSTGS